MGLLVNIVDISTTKFRACSLLLYSHAPFSPWFHLVTVIVHLLYHVLPLSVAETLHWWWNASVMPWPNWCLFTLTQLWGVLWMFSHPVHACCSYLGTVLSVSTFISIILLDVLLLHQKWVFCEAGTFISSLFSSCIPVSSIFPCLAQVAGYAKYPLHEYFIYPVSVNSFGTMNKYLHNVAAIICHSLFTPVCVCLGQL